MLGRAARATGSHRLGAIEDQLVRAGRGDEHAFAELYDQTAHNVYGLVLRVLGDPHQAEDVTQEAFLEIWRMSARFDPDECSAMGWMLALAHRRAVDCLRANSGTHQREDSSDEAGTPVEASPAPLQSRSIAAALAALPPSQQQTVELAYFGGHTSADVSRLLQVPLDTTLNGLRTSLLGLRQQLGSAAVEAS